MKTFPLPFYGLSSQAPATPGYRILGKDEVLLTTDECYNQEGHWIKTTFSGSKVGYGQTFCPYRRALCVDDPYAPPVDQWSVPGWQVLTNPHEMLGKGVQSWNHVGQQWQPTPPNWSNQGVGSFMVYLRRPVVLGSISLSKTNPGPGYRLLTLSGCHELPTSGDDVWSDAAGWIPWNPPRGVTPFGHETFRRKVGAESAPTKRLNPGQSIVISVGSSSVLSRAVQEAAFAAGWVWNDGQFTYSDITDRSYGDRNALVLTPIKGMYVVDAARNLADKGGLILNARTDLGLLMDLLAAHPTPKAPVIHGYAAEYVKDSPTIQFGCATLSIEMLSQAARAMGMMRIHGKLAVLSGGGNRFVISIILDSGKTLSKDQVAAILSYVDQVNGKPGPSTNRINIDAKS